jgi:excisionase family DNA binding protein
MTEMLTAKDIQDLLQVDRSTVYRMAEAGRLPALKVGRQWRFPAERIKQWMVTNDTEGVVTLPDAPPVAEELASLLPLECVQLIQDTFAAALGVMVVVTDMDGEAITRVSNPCGFFNALRPWALDKCAEQWKEMATAVELEPRFIRSHLGLLCARGMVHTGARLQGMVFVGGIAPDDWPPAPDEVESLAREAGVASAAVAARVDEVFLLDAQQRQHVLSLVQPMANIVSHIAGERGSMLAQLEAFTSLTALEE